MSVRHYSAAAFGLSEALGGSHDRTRRTHYRSCRGQPLFIHRGDQGCAHVS